jgi:glycosyltransferase involved in cell wall biosynthesis
LGGAPAEAARRISVVVPTCNRAAKLRKALASIRAVEGPDLRLEIIIGDNGACPETPGLADEFGAIHVRTSVMGASASRNAAMAKATGDYIAFLDDDDAWLPAHIRPHLDMLDQRPDLDGVIAQVRFADEDLLPLPTGDWPDRHPGEGDELVRRMLSGFFPQIGTTVVRASVRETSGPFDPDLIGGEDLDWLMRLSGRHALGFVQTPVILFSQRKIGDYDALNRLRINYDRKVFRRHARRHWRVWRSPIDYMRAYSGTLRHFFTYFSQVALMAAQNGERLRALGAIRTAFAIFPLRATKYMLTSSNLRSALLLAVFALPISHRVHLPLWLVILHV